jgi:chemotaxis protein methyltransferase CheR
MATTCLPDFLLSQVSEIIAARTGWHFPPDRWHDLERGLRAAAQDLGFVDVRACIEWLPTATLTQQQVAILADHFTVGETYFFREQRALEVLTTQILPPLMQARQSDERHLRIWSAACCTGEEPYSIAITLTTAFPSLSGWQVSIIGTDINPRFLQRAENGVYTEWSFRNTPAWIKERYFQRTADNRFTLSPEIKRMVTFFPLNLADNEFSQPLHAAATIDIIFCRNVFIYFSPQRAQTVLLNFHRLLTDRGWLIVSPSETSYLAQLPFTAVAFPGIIVHRKGTASSEPLPCKGALLHPAQERFPVTPIPRPAADLRLLVERVSTNHTKTDDAAVMAAQPSSAPKHDLKSASVLPHPSAIYRQAKVLYEQGRYAEVTEKLRDSLTRQSDQHTPLDEEEMLLLIRACANQGAFNEATAWCQRAIAANVLSSRLYYLLATVLLEQGREDEAKLALRQTLYLDDRFILAHFTLGNLSRRQKKIQDAQRHFHNALTLLQQYQPEEILPESEGLTAGRLSALIRTMLLS